MNLIKIIRKGFLLMFFLISGLELNGQDQEYPMITDRPDMTESSVSVQPGIMQVETGFHFEKESTGGVSQFYRNLNTSLIRYGLVDGLEFRLGFGYSSFSSPGETEQGFEPLSFGFKYELFGQSGILPEMAVLNTFVPDFSGSSEFKPEKWQGTILGAMAWELGELGLGANLGTSFEEENTIFPYSAALGFPVSNALGGFVEVFGAFAKEEGPSHSGNVGITWLLNPDFQLDAYYGFGLNDRAVDWSAGFGFSWRFDT